MLNFLWMITEILAFMGEMHQNWLEKPSVEQNNHSVLKWLSRGIVYLRLSSSPKYLPSQQTT